MESIKLTNYPDKVEKVAERSVSKRSKGRPLPSIPTVTALANAKRIERLVRRKYNVNERSYTVILELLSMWITSRAGMTMTQLCKAMFSCESGSNMICVHASKELLISRGLVEYLGNSKYGHKLYGPTLKLLREVNEVCSVVA